MLNECRNKMAMIQMQSEDAVKQAKAHRMVRCATEVSMGRIPTTLLTVRMPYTANA